MDEIRLTPKQAQRLREIFNLGVNPRTGQYEWRRNGGWENRKGPADDALDRLGLLNKQRFSEQVRGEPRFWWSMVQLTPAGRAWCERNPA